MKLLAISILLSAGLAQAEPAVPDAAWAQAWLDQAYLPRHQALTDAADALVSETRSLCQKPELAQLEATKQSWLTTSQTWRAMDGAPAGPMVLERMGRKIDFRPTRPDDIEQAIQGGDTNNAATRGLPAMEYLLWGDAQKSQLKALKQPQRCAYLLQQAEHVAKTAHGLDAAWAIYRSELGAENPFFRENIFSEHINLMLASMTSLGKRMPTANPIKPEQFVEWRSGSSKAQFMAQWGGMSSAMARVNEYLLAHGAQQVAAAVQKDMQNAQQTCEKLPENLAKSKAADRLACSQAINQLKTRVQSDVGDKLDLTLGFNEGDGD